MNTLVKGQATPEFESIAEVLAWVTDNQEEYIIADLESVDPTTLPPLQDNAYAFASGSDKFQVYIETDMYKNNFKGWVWKVSSVLVNPLTSALSGDIVLEISPEAVDREATDAVWTRTVTLTLKNTAGEVLTFYNGTQETKASIATDSVAGAPTIASQDIVFVNGVSSIVVSGDAADWLEDETDTLTIANLSVNNFTVTGGTSVQTFVAAT